MLCWHYIQLSFRVRLLNRYGLFGTEPSALTILGFVDTLMQFPSAISSRILTSILSFYITLVQEKVFSTSKFTQI